jgi:hypothetical protein
MAVLLSKKPKASEYKNWHEVYSSDKVEVFQNLDVYDYYQLKADGITKYFFGESAWMNVQRVASDYDFQAWGMFDR